MTQIFEHYPGDIPPDAKFTLRLRGNTGNNYVFSLNPTAKGGSLNTPALLKPGEYTVKTENFIRNGIVYLVTMNAKLTASTTTPVEINIIPAANLQVPGFPPFLSFGGCADLTTNNVDDFAAAMTSEIFTYAGVSGSGDPDKFLEEDAKTTAMLRLASDIEKKIGNNHHVLPMMISYTCDLSGGDFTNLVNEKKLKHSYANYMLALSLARQRASVTSPISAAFIVNADYLGFCQQENRVSNPKTHYVPVRRPLEEAITHALSKSWIIERFDIPEEITNTMYGYVLSVNWLTRIVAHNCDIPGSGVALGWQSNLWGVGGAKWVYDTRVDVRDNAIKTAKYALDAGVFEGKYAADFHAIDRYERDDLAFGGYGNSYCYGPSEWQRFYDFCQVISEHLKKPVMPWQIPASRLPTKREAVYEQGADLGSSPLNDQHWGTSGSYLLGDEDIANDKNNIHPNILKLKFLENTLLLDFYKTAGDQFTAPFDITEPAYKDFPKRGIFHVALGGGSTTGIINTVGKTGPWTQNKLAKYIKKPVEFK